MRVLQQPSYEFSSQPRPKTRPKFRPVPDYDTRNAHHHQDAPLPMNIHYDPRVARGNTFAGDIRRKGGHATIDPALSRPEVKSRKGLGRSRARNSSAQFFDQKFNRPTASDEIDMSRFLLEPGEDQIRPENDTETQTDAFQERPQTPDFVAKKTGVDASTQIEASDNLFKFDLEVQPLLAVLVGKTLENARIEVEREHELECIRQAALALNRQREDEAQRVAALKEAAVAAEREKEELRRRRREEAAARRVAKEKVACLQLMRQVLPMCLEAAMADLREKSWTTPTAHQINEIFMPWVWDRLATDVDETICARKLLCGLHSAVNEKAEAVQNRRIEEKQRAQEALAEAHRAALAKVMHFFVSAQLVGREEGSESLGPIEVRAGDTVEEVESAVGAWLTKNRGVTDDEEDGAVSVPEGGFLRGYMRKAGKLARLNVGKGDVKGGVLGPTSTLFEVQERSGVVADEVLLQPVA